jgi:TRAP-type mannitol/chloroaromatic compound transport system permease large subunit
MENPMRLIATGLLTACLLVTSAHAIAGERQAKALLEEVGKAYRNAPTLTDTMTLDLDGERHTMRLRFDKDNKRAQFDVPGYAIMAIDGNLRWSVVREAAIMSVRTTCMIGLMMVGTQIISISLSVLQIPAQISAYFASLPVEPWMIAVLVGLFYILLGCLIEGTSMFFLTFPVIFPMMMSIGFDPIWFGVMMALFIEMSLITPPVGLNLFIIQQVSDEPGTGPAIKGSWPFFLLLVAVMGLFIAFPEIVLFLPGKL